MSFLDDLHQGTTRPPPKAGLLSYGSDGLSFIFESLAEGIIPSVVLYLVLYFFIQNRLTTKAKIILFFALWFFLSIILKIVWDTRH